MAKKKKNLTAQLVIHIRIQTKENKKLKHIQ